MSSYENGSYDPRSEHRRKREHRDRRNHIPRIARYTPSDYSQSEAYSQRAPPAGSEYSHHTATEPPAAEDQYQLAPYDDEKAYAEYSRVYGPPSPEPTCAPPPRQRRRNSYDDGRPPYKQNRRRYTDDRPDDLMTYDRHGRPRDDISPGAASTSYDGRDSRYDDHYDIPPPKEPEEEGKSGLKSSLIGGVSGAYLGNRFVGKGALGTLGGAVAGAIGVNAMEHFDGKRQKKREEKDRRRRVDDIANEAMIVEPRGKYYGRNYYPDYDTPARSRYTDRGLPRGPYEARHRRRSRPRYRSLSVGDYERRH